MAIEGEHPNHFYTVLRNQMYDIPVEDFNIAVAPSIDSFVVGAQAKTALPYTQQTDITLYPSGAVSAYIYLNILAMSTRQASSDAATTAIRVDYLDLNGATHPLFVFDNRLFSMPNVFLQRIIPVPIDQPIPGTVQQPGIIGNLIFTVVQTSSVAGHAITYDIFLNGCFVYVVPEEPIDLLIERHVQKHSWNLVKNVEKVVQDVISAATLAAKVPL